MMITLIITDNKIITKEQEVKVTYLIEISVPESTPKIQIRNQVITYFNRKSEENMSLKSRTLCLVSHGGEDVHVVLGCNTVWSCR
jgi:hypothetical protein